MWARTSPPPAFPRRSQSSVRRSARYRTVRSRVAQAFPSTLREKYADRPWGWFRECVRERDPRTAAERHAGLSIAQIKDLRKTKQIPREPGYVRLHITIRPDRVADLVNGQTVTVTRALPSGEELKVVLTRSR